MNCISGISTYINSLVFVPPKTNLHYINKLPPRCESFFVRTQTYSIHCLLCTSAKPSERIIIFSHGNASDNSTMLSYLKYLSDNLALNVIGYDYLGYGLSVGEPNEDNCYTSLYNVVKYATSELNFKQPDIFLMGQSLGTGVVINFAYRHKWKTSIILISPFKSVVSIKLPYSRMLSCIDIFTSITKIQYLRCNVKFFHGQNDDLIPLDHSIELYKLLSYKFLKPTWLKNCGHNDILSKIDLNDIKNVIN